MARQWLRQRFNYFSLSAAPAPEYFKVGRLLPRDTREIIASSLRRGDNSRLAETDPPASTEQSAVETTNLAQPGTYVLSHSVAGLTAELLTTWRAETALAIPSHNQ